LERIRESMAKELVNMSDKIEKLEENANEYPELQDKFKVFKLNFGIKSRFFLK